MGILLAICIIIMASQVVLTPAVKAVVIALSCVYIIYKLLDFMYKIFENSDRD